MFTLDCFFTSVPTSLPIQFHSFSIVFFTRSFPLIFHGMFHFSFHLNCHFILTSSFTLTFTFCFTLLFTWIFGPWVHPTRPPVICWPARTQYKTGLCLWSAKSTPTINKINTNENKNVWKDKINQLFNSGQKCRHLFIVFIFICFIL